MTRPFYLAYRHGVMRSPDHPHRGCALLHHKGRTSCTPCRVGKNGAGTSDRLSKRASAPRTFVTLESRCATRDRPCRAMGRAKRPCSRPHLQAGSIPLLASLSGNVPGRHKQGLEGGGAISSRVSLPAISAIREDARSARTRRTFTLSPFGANGIVASGNETRVVWSGDAPLCAGRVRTVFTARCAGNEPRHRIVSCTDEACFAVGASGACPGCRSISVGSGWTTA